MLFVISPAKSLNFETPSNATHFTDPLLVLESQKIMDSLRKKSVKKLMELQSISPDLANLNWDRNQNWTATNNDENSKQAISAFSGEVYIGLSEMDFDADEYDYAQDHLRILSGLYGVIKPLDRIQPYRLEMGTSLKTSRGKNLYEFWKNRITDQFNIDLENGKTNVLVNLASDEYFKSIKTEKLNAQVIQPVFMDWKNGKYKVLSFFAKKARGMMVRFAVKNRLSEVDQLKAFDSEGYIFNPELSEDHKWVFTRNQE